MANIIPQQICINKDGFILEYNPDIKRTPNEISNLLTSILGNSYQRIKFGRFRNACGQYTREDGKKYFFIVANLTFMGGKEGQHPKDLKRIQYNIEWRNFYNRYSSDGTVIWLGLYSYKDLNIWAFFYPESYIKKHEGQSMSSKGGYKAMYSCHIFLNDLKMGFEYGKNFMYHKKRDKYGNTVGSIRFECLKYFFEGKIDGCNPILAKIDEINANKVDGKGWIRADVAIPYMKSLLQTVGFNKWQQNMWNGWLVEAYYSEYLDMNPSDYIHYVATTKTQEVKDEYKGFTLDLAFPGQKEHFIGDLKAVSIGDDDTYLNDETIINRALEKYKKIWFVFYIHDKIEGKTNDYEMVKWRNHYILNEGFWKKEKVFSELSAPNTPHSIRFKKMVIIELNEITKDKYFFLRRQGRNSNGKPRKDKYAINKKILSDLDNDGLVIARYIF